MTSVIILGFLAGALFVNGLPHLVRGAAGKKLASPFGDESMVNVTWGWINWIVAVLLWHEAPMASHPRAAFVSAALGVLLMGWAVSMGKLNFLNRK